MLKALGVIIAVYGIAWIVSTPESRAAAKPAVDAAGKLLCICLVVVLGVGWLLFGRHGPP